MRIHPTDPDVRAADVTGTIARHRQSSPCRIFRKPGLAMLGSKEILWARGSRMRFPSARAGDRVHEHALRGSRRAINRRHHMPKTHRSARTEDEDGPTYFFHRRTSSPVHSRQRHLCLRHNSRGFTATLPTRPVNAISRGTLYGGDALSAPRRF